MSATIIPFPKVESGLAREWSERFPESTREERLAFASFVRRFGAEMGRQAIEGRALRQSLEQVSRKRARDLPTRAELVRRVLQRAKARRDAWRPGGAG